MLLSGFKEEIYEKGLREEGREEGMKEGREEGIKEGMEQAIRNMLDLGLSKETIAEKYPIELIEKVMKETTKE